MADARDKVPAGEATGGAHPHRRWGVPLGVSVALAVALLVPAWLRMSSQPPPSYAQGPGHHVIRMTDFAFSPSRMVWRVGDQVSVTIINDSQAHPGTAHEFMMGRQPNREDTPLGARYPGGFVHDFFSGVHVTLSRTQKAEIVMPGTAMLMGPDADKPFVMREEGEHDGMDMGSPSPGMTGMPGMTSEPPESPMPGMPGMDEEHAGFMVQLNATGVTTISFVVPDKPGIWQFGCFSQTGEHFANGMKGQVEIVR